MDWLKTWMRSDVVRCEVCAGACEGVFGELTACVGLRWLRWCWALDIVRMVGRGGAKAVSVG